MYTRKSCVCFPPPKDFTWMTVANKVPLFPSPYTKKCVCTYVEPIIPSGLL